MESFILFFKMDVLVKSQHFQYSMVCFVVLLEDMQIGNKDMLS